MIDIQSRFFLLLSIMVGGGAVDGVGDDGGRGVNGGSEEVGDQLQQIVLNSFDLSTGHLSCSAHSIKSFPYYKVGLVPLMIFLVNFGFILEDF